MTRPVRVLSIATLFPCQDKPGFGRFVERQFDALAQTGEVELTVIVPFTRRRRKGAPHSYPVHFVQYTSIPKIGARWNPLRIARSVIPLARKLHDEHPFDIVDAQFFYPDGPAALRVARALELPLSIKARGSDINYWGGRQFARQMMLEAAGESKGLLAVSQALRQAMIGLGMPEEKIAVHYTGLDHSLFHPRDRLEAKRQLFSFSPDKAVLLSVGNLVPVKGHDLAIEAMNYLTGAHLVIVGKGPLLATLKRQASSLHTIDKVSFASYDSEKMALAMAAADALVLPSENEGLANVWIEALASGTPLVIPDVGGAREVLTSPTAGRLVDRDPVAIARAVCDLLSCSPSQSEVAVHAARFDWRANATQLAAHYRAIAS